MINENGCHKEEEPTGFFRVTRINNPRSGFLLYYEYTIDTPLVFKKIKAHKLLDLKIKVQNKGFLWGVIDENLAKHTCYSQNEPLFQLYGHYGVKPKVPNTIGDILHPLKHCEVHIVNKDPLNCLPQEGYTNYREIYLNHYNVKLPREIQIHHIDRNKSNDSIENLVAVTYKEHSNFHKLLHQLNKKGFVQPITNETPIVYEYSNKLIYSFILADAISMETDFGWEEFYPEFKDGYLLHNQRPMYLPAEDWETLEHIIKVHKLYWNKSVPIIQGGDLK